MKCESRVIKKAQIILIGNTIRCNRFTIQISNISRVWVGNLPINLSLVYDILILSALILIGFHFMNSMFIAISVIGLSAIMMAYKYFFKSKSQCLNLKISSGDVYSFESENIDFVNEVFELISEIMIENRSTANFIINFKGEGNIIDNLEVVEEYGLVTQQVNSNHKKANNTLKLNTNEQELINTSLLKLQSNYKEKNENSMEILNFVENTMQLVKNNNKAGIKSAFAEFVALGLINDCNELGLSDLIEEIKKNIY